MNSKAQDKMFAVDIDTAIGMLKAKSECLSRKWEYRLDLKCNEKCDECDLMYAQGNCGQIENMYENTIEWLEELKCYRNENDFSKYADRLYKKAYNKALDDMINIIKEMRETAQFLMKTDYEYACDRFIEQVEQLRKGEDNTMKKVYISGKITGTKDYMERFAECEKKLTEQGYSVINPSKVNAMLPQDTEYEEYMRMSFTMLEMCDTIYMMHGWNTSNGACMEYDKAKELGKEIMFE